MPTIHPTAWVAPGAFVRGEYDTGYLDQNLDRLLELARTCERLTDDREAEE